MMTLSPYDFGREPIPELSDMAFLLDTNFIISTIVENHDYHYACRYFYLHLINRDIPLLVSEVVIMEVMHVLARSFYRLHESQPESTWYRNSKRNPDLLALYNAMARDAFSTFLEPDNLLFQPLNLPFAQLSLDLCPHIPLHSADALIATAARRFADARLGIISLDADMARIPDIDIFTTRIPNDRFDHHRMSHLLDIEDLLLAIKKTGPSVTETPVS